MPIYYFYCIFSLVISFLSRYGIICIYKNVSSLRKNYIPKTNNNKFYFLFKLSCNEKKTVFPVESLISHYGINVSYIPNCILMLLLHESILRAQIFSFHNIVT